MVAEKYPGYCSRCVEYPPANNTWCTLCYQSNPDERPNAFWGLDDGGLRFAYRCECGYKTPRDVSKSQAFAEILVDHFLDMHKMHIQDALKKVSLDIMPKEVIRRYIVPNPEK